MCHSLISSISCCFVIKNNKSVWSLSQDGKRENERERISLANCLPVSPPFTFLCVFASVWLCVQEQLHNWTQPNPVSKIQTVSQPCVHTEKMCMSCSSGGYDDSFETEWPQWPRRSWSSEPISRPLLKPNIILCWILNIGLILGLRSGLASCDGFVVNYPSSARGQPQKRFSGKEITHCNFKVQRLHFVYNFYFRCASYFYLFL